MKKSKALRLAGFAGALCASGALLGTSISGTGAYFTDSHSGEINTSTGHVKVAIDPVRRPAELHQPAARRLPGPTASPTPLRAPAPRTSGWCFPTTGPDGNRPKHSPARRRRAGGGLGRYGHFALSSTGGANFTSYNLNNAGTGPSTPAPRAGSTATAGAAATSSRHPRRTRPGAVVRAGQRNPAPEQHEQRRRRVRAT